MRLAVLSALCVTLATPARADDWTDGDTALQLTMATLQVIDWAQTSYGMQHGQQELNPLLGSHPTKLRLGLTVSAGIVVHAGISRVLPKPYRTYWQVLSISLQAGAVGGNALMFGMHLSLP